MPTINLDPIFNAVSWLTNAKDAFNEMTDDIGEATKDFSKEMNEIASGAAQEAIDVIVENPGKTAAIVGATLVTGGIAAVAAPTIAAGIGTTGILGTSMSGTAISTLSGAALKSASLAAIGGGSVAAGGGGMAAGTAIVAGSGAATGLAVSAGVVAAKNKA